MNFSILSIHDMKLDDLAHRSHSQKNIKITNFKNFTLYVSLKWIIHKIVEIGRLHGW